MFGDVRKLKGVTRREMEDKAVRAYIMKTFNGGIEDSYKALVTDPSNRPTIEEKYFVGIYLPIFSGQAGQGKENPYGASIHTWITDVAKANYNPVDVVDESGNVLYTVPPIAPYNAVNPIIQGDTEMGLKEMAVNAARLSVAAIHGTDVNYIMDFMEENADNYVNMSYNKEYAEQWIRIYKHYNIPMPWEKKKEEGKAETNKSEEVGATGVKEQAIVFDDFD